MKASDLLALVSEWRHEADVAEKNLDFNLRHGNIDDNEHIQVYRSCADELESLVKKEQK